MREVKYHSRHIPIEHLNLDHPMGRRVVENGLCDILKPGKIRALRDFGIDVIETRLTWAELEPTPGRYDWSRLERDIALIEQGGIGVGVFPWFQHPPAWADTLLEKSVSLNQGKRISIPSLWDARLLETYDRLYAALAAKFGNRIDFIYCCAFGDYGEVLFPFGVKHYHFSSTEGHFGFWCGDPLARRDFSGKMRMKYSEISVLNHQWETSFTSWDDDLMPLPELSKNKLRRRRDFAEWYSGSLLDFTEGACAAMRRHFPSTRAALPMGWPREDLEVGQIKSVVAKIAARHRMTARWTGIALHHDDFARNHLVSRRVSSAARFYGTSFGLEASLEMDEAVPAIYETLTNETALLHNDPGNIARKLSTYQHYKPLTDMRHPVECDIAVFYPVEGEQWLCLTETGERGEGTCDEDFSEIREIVPRKPIDVFLDACAELRHHCDFEVADSFLISDGFLEKIKTLIIPSSVPIPQATALRIVDWIRKKQGRFLYMKTLEPVIIEGRLSWSVFAREQGLSENRIKENGVASWPKFEPYALLRARHGEDAFYTLHNGNCASRFDPKTDRITFIDVPENAKTVCHANGS